MYAALWICAPLVECLSNLALRANYDDGNRGVTEAVLRNTPHALRAKGNSECLLHRACATRANYNESQICQNTNALERICEWDGWIPFDRAQPRRI
jgi:hypothetical protein